MIVIDSGLVPTRAADAQGTPTQSHTSPSIRVHEDEAFASGSHDRSVRIRDAATGNFLLLYYSQAPELSDTKVCKFEIRTRLGTAASATPLPVPFVSTSLLSIPAVRFLHHLPSSPPASLPPSLPPALPPFLPPLAGCYKMKRVPEAKTVTWL